MFTLTQSVCIIINKDHPLAAYDKIPVKRLYGCNIIAPTYGWDDIIKSELGG